LRLSGEFLFVNSTRLRLDLTNYASFGYILRLCRAAGVGALRVHAGSTAREWLVVVSLLDPPSAIEPAELFMEIYDHLHKTGVPAIDIGPPVDDEADREFAEQAKRAATRTYTHSVAATRDVINSVRMGRTPSIKKIKRV